MKRRNTETKQSLWKVTNYPDDPVNQSELEANACRRREVRENVSERVMTCSILLSRLILCQPLNAVMENQ